MMTTLITQIPPTPGRVSPIRRRYAWSIVLSFAFVFLSSPTANAGNPVVGFTEPVKTIRLAASETGILETLNVKRGDTVTARQVVGALDTGVLRARRALAKAKVESQSRLKSAGIKLTRASHNFDKLSQLRTEGHSGKRELEIAASDLELAKIDLEVAQEESHLSRLTLNQIDAEIRRRTVISPVNGVVTETHREVGEFVAMSEPAVVTIADLSALRIRFYSPTGDAESVRVGQIADVRFVHSGEVFSGTIDFVAPVIDADSNTIQIDVLLDNLKRNHRSGRRCALILPRKASNGTPKVSLRKGERR